LPVAVWDLATGKKRGELTGFEKQLFGVAVAPDGKHAVTASEDGVVRFFDLATCEKVGAERLVALGNSSGVRAAGFSHDGKYLATTHDDGTVTFWTTAGFRPLLTFRANLPAGLRAATFSPDGRRLAVASQRGVVRFWDVGGLLQAADKEGH